jgi:transcriptional regulator with XRE-family HTH domain
METKINLEFKVAIIKKFGSQVVAARELGVRESRLSYLIRGHSTPTIAERNALAEAFGRRFVDQTFKQKIQNTSKEKNHGKKNT